MYEFKFPDVGEGIHEGRIVEWLVKEGDTLQMDQSFVKVETDKAVVELPVPKAGTVLKLYFQTGATIHVGDVIASFGEAGEKAAVSAAAAAPPVAGQPAAVATAPVATVATSAPAAPATRPSPAPTAAPVPPARIGRIQATPHTRALARKLGVDLLKVTPSGRSGQVTDEDVERAAKGGTQAPVAASATVAAPSIASGRQPAGVSSVTEEGPVERIPLTHLRKVIAEAMHHSRQTSAHVTHVDEADVTELWAAFAKTKAAMEAEGAKSSVLAFFVKAVIAALKRHPLLNASYDEAKGELVVKKYYHIGLAVDTPEGLIVPVLRDADKKDMVQITQGVADLAARARDRKLQLHELKGASFTLTNIGSIGGLFATPIIHQPEMAIVGLHTMKERPAVVNGQVVPRKMMYLSVSFDHRFVDGAEAARFMVDLVQMVENPFLLLSRV